MAIFENIHTRDEAFYKEIYFHHYFKSKIYRFIDILMGISILIGLVGLLFEVRPDYTAYGCFVFIILFRVIMYCRIVKVSMARQKEVSAGGDILYTITVTEDSITHKSSLGSEYSIGFSSIKKAYQTKNYIILQSGARQWYIFKKDGFVMGNCDDFSKFLKIKGYKIGR